MSALNGTSRERAAIHAYYQGDIDRRAVRGITTETETTMSRHQEILAEVLNLLEALKAEKRSRE